MTKPEAKHSPLPWIVGSNPTQLYVVRHDEYGCQMASSTIVVEPGEDAETRGAVREDLEFACRAVNAHAALVEAASKVLALVEKLDARWGGQSMHDDVQALRAALKLAQEGK